jgi:L-lysine 6-transaminase
MVRSTKILEIIVNENLLDNARDRGAELLGGLERVQARFSDLVSNARGVGLMCALAFATTELRDRVIRLCFDDQMIVLPAGRRSIRFRPTLTVVPEAIAEGLTRLERAVERAASERA